MMVIHPGTRGNVMQALTWKCGVPGCEAEEVHEEVAGIGELPPDPMLEGPDGWRLVHRMWICARHEIVIDPVTMLDRIEGGLVMLSGDDHWTRDGSV